jgi:hypothetical protein
VDFRTMGRRGRESDGTSLPPELTRVEGLWQPLGLPVPGFPRWPFDEGRQRRMRGEPMKKTLKPGEAPATGDIQPREGTTETAGAAQERRRRKAVDEALAKERPTDERVEGLTGKYIA